MTLMSSSPNPTIDPAPLPIDADLLCGHCGQNLRGVASGRCPECGGRFDRSRIVDVSVPWEQRRRLGRFRAYWRTARFFTARGPAVADRAEVTLRSARSFRRCVMLLTCIWVAAAVLLWRHKDPRFGNHRHGSLLSLVPNASDLPNLFSNPWFFGTSLAALCLWMGVAVGMSEWFFPRKGRTPAERRRTMALNGYSVAPLVWMPIFGSLAILFVDVEAAYARVPAISFPAAAAFGTSAVLCAMCPADYWWSVLRLLHLVTRSRMRVMFTAVFLPLLWAVAACAIFLGLHFAVNFIAFVYMSVRS